MGADTETAAAPSAGPLKLPIPHPTTDSVPPERPALTDDQTKKYEWLLEQARGWTTVPSKDPSTAGPLTDEDRLWLTRECLLRYLRATKWHEKEAAKRLKDTLTWRREYGVDALTADHISPENETGKQVLLGYDKQGRVCHYLNPGRQNTDVSPRQVQHLVYMVERVIDIMPAGQETLALLINFKTSKSRSNTAPGISTGREVLHILQTHYPERLGRALIINVPWVVWGFFKLITPFIDPLTREKLKFNEDMNQYVPSEQLWTEFLGKLEFDYDHDVYWPALTKLAAERRAARVTRWEAGGKQIGELEDYLFGKLAEGIQGAAAVAAPVAAAVETPAAPGAAPAPEVIEAADTTAATSVEDLKVADLKVNDETPAAKTEEAAVAA
ncbi:Phosphatidylinositol transfer protein (PITP) [Sporothrix eucalyptigena]|uniref:Phosphatidylinositol transfer protein (PITP) n=1 Tax=Sporothrix eucalyptigena TaxID=1812306 RepID=A0ABP0BR09_9PEZI